jgi:hypothetical protein
MTVSGAHRTPLTVTLSSTIGQRFFAVFFVAFFAVSFGAPRLPPMPSGFAAIVSVLRR